MSVHPTAAAGFSAAADAYERGRPDYPAEAVAWLVRRLGVGSGTTVVDLAAGTGKLTRMLVATGARVIAVEPVGPMRATLEALVPGADARDGTAESIPVASASAEVVTVAQAFHWFSNDAALMEIHRVLSPGGHLVLAWNKRDTSQPLQRVLNTVISRRRSGEPTHHTDEWKDVLARSRLFGGGGSLEEVAFPHVQRLDPGGVVDRVSSVSFVATLPPEDRLGLLSEVRGAIEGLPQPIELRYTTHIYIAGRS